MANLSDKDIQEIKSLVKDIATSFRKIVLCVEELEKFITVEEEETDGNTE